MKLKEALYFLGLKPKIQTYGFEINTFELPVEGSVSYAQWLHPRESKKIIRQDTVDEIKKFLALGDVAIDIGAHTGDSTVPIALAVGKTGCILALEPNKYVFSILEKNSELNKDKTNIVPLMFAATEEDGEFEFNYSDAGFCNGGFHAGVRKMRHAHAFSLKVQAKNLLSFLQAEYSELIQKIRFIKVDAQGYDYTILKTLEKLISAQKPFIKAEIPKLTLLPAREQFYRFLTNYGYEIFLVEEENNYRGQMLKKENLEDRKHYDIFCIPKD